jgi:hypothetical protein
LIEWDYWPARKGALTKLPLCGVGLQGGFGAKLEKEYRWRGV